MIGGDFNAVKNGGERKGRTTLGNHSEWDEFSCFINDIGLVDVPIKGKKFSWFSGDGKLKSRIDSFLVSNVIVNMWGVVKHQVGSRDIFNQCHI